MNNLSKQKLKSPRAAYMGYLFQTFFKRPFGYIIAILYILYLSIILVIVPAALKFEPLFIWNIGGFNMPIFNLFFIAASAASIAVAVFRTGRDDGSDLNISAKPLTKNSTVLLKTMVYLLIMFLICVLITGIIALIKPIFGTYDPITNITGITDEKYVGLILSVLVGNIVNMLLFGGLSVFISMVGGQVITIIGTVAIVFVMCLLNFLFPQVIKSSIDVLSEKYDTEILSYSCNTLHQYKYPEDGTEPFNFAAIQCITDDDGDEEYHYDTKQYWDIAEKEAGRKLANYVDFGKQLSSLYSSFGLDDSKLKEASKLVIGMNNSYNYDIDKSTHVDNTDNIEHDLYPIAYYTTTQRQGKEYPIILMIGGNMTLTSSNWYLYSTLFQVDFASINYASISSSDMVITENLRERCGNKPWNKMGDLTLTQEQLNEVDYLYKEARDKWQWGSDFASYCNGVISQEEEFYDGKPYNELSEQQQFDVTSKFHLRWAILAQQDQRNHIENWTPEQFDQFPFSSKQVVDWYHDLSGAGPESAYLEENNFNAQLFASGIAINSNGAYSRLVTSKLAYAETYSNLYQYTVSSFYNLTHIIAIWTALSCCLFTASIIVYKKSDFK